jgi:hypothetical protein
MPIDQYSAFVQVLPQIEKALIKKGERVPRPQYNGEVKEDDGKDEHLSDAGDDGDVPQKSNIEATSDEDED